MMDLSRSGALGDTVDETSVTPGSKEGYAQVDHPKELFYGNVSHS